MHLQDETKQIEELQERVAEASKKVGPPPLACLPPPACWQTDALPCTVRAGKGLGFCV